MTAVPPNGAGPKSEASTSSSTSNGVSGRRNTFSHDERPGASPDIHPDLLNLSSAPTGHPARLVSHNSRTLQPGEASAAGGAGGGPAAATAAFNPFKKKTKDPAKATWGSFMRKGGMDDVEGANSDGEAKAAVDPRVGALSKPDTDRAQSCPDAGLGGGANAAKIDKAAGDACINPRAEGFPSLSEASQDLQKSNSPKNSASADKRASVSAQRKFVDPNDLKEVPHPIWPGQRILTRANTLTDPVSAPDKTHHRSQTAAATTNLPTAQSRGSKPGGAKPGGGALAAMPEHEPGDSEHRLQATPGHSKNPSVSLHAATDSEHEPVDDGRVTTDGDGDTCPMPPPHGQPQISRSESQHGGIRSDVLNIPAKYMDAFVEGQGDDADAPKKS